MNWEPATLDLGDLRLTVVDGGSFRLDGATLYGVLPRVFWERMNRPDGDNRVLLATAPAVVETRAGVVVVDPGPGDGWGEAATDRYDLRGQRSLSEMLAGAGVKPDDVAGVIATHLHFDHVSASVRIPSRSQEGATQGWVWGNEGGEETEPSLPTARFYVQRAEYAAAEQPELRTAAYVAPSVCGAWERAGRLELLEGPAEPFPGVRVEATGGHTPGHQVVWLEGSDGTALLGGDLLPTTTHLRGEVMEGVDHAPAVSAAAKAALLARARQQRAWITFYHAPRVRWGRLRAATGRYELEETLTGAPVTRGSSD